MHAKLVFGTLPEANLRDPTRGMRDPGIGAVVAVDDQYAKSRKLSIVNIGSQRRVVVVGGEVLTGGSDCCLGPAEKSRQILISAKKIRTVKLQLGYW